MKLSSEEIHNITKLADAAARLIEASGIAANHVDTSGAEQLAKRMTEIALQMATTEIKAGPFTPDAAQAIKDHWKLNQGGVTIMPLRGAIPSETDDPMSWGQERIQARMDEIVGLTGGGDEEWMRPLNEEFAYLRGCLAVLDNPDAFHRDCPLDEPAVIETLRTDAEPVDTPTRPTAKWVEPTSISPN